jgi:phosphohistidine phosphatase
MKTLIMVRHAKSDWTNPLQKDFDRTLNERGLANAPMMGSRLLQRGILIDSILSSTARRAEQTANLIANSLQYPSANINWQAHLYHAEPDTIFDCISETKNTINNLLVVCHNPGITNFVNSICGVVTANMPTCGMAAFQIATDDWNELYLSKSKLLFFDFPKKEFK